MENTQNDLSFDSAKIDFEALLQTASIAQALLIRSIRSDLDTTEQRYRENKEIPTVWTNSLKAKADSLAKVQETFRTLHNAKVRHNIEIVNHKASTIPDCKSCDTNEYMELENFNDDESTYQCDICDYIAIVKY